MRIILMNAGWGPISSGVAAVGTIAAVLVALFGPLVWRLFWRPRLKVEFEEGEPSCRFTDLSDGGKAYWVRVRVSNVGRSSAVSCVGKFTAAWTGEVVRHDKDPMQLRWCGVPDRRGFEPIHLAPAQHEFLDLFRITRGDSSLRFETFPNYAPGFATALEANQDHIVRVTVVADNASPAEIHVSIRYDGDFDAIPSSLRVAAIAA